MCLSDNIPHSDYHICMFNEPQNLGQNIIWHIFYKKFTASGQCASIFKLMWPQFHGHGKLSKIQTLTWDGPTHRQK